ncbi:hypothetical protein EMCRGX_G020387 [Ephydatia muelleri]
MGCFSCNAGDEGGRISVQVEFLGDLLLSYFNLLQEKRLISGVLFAGSLAWIYGNPNRIIYPVDTNGQLCGYDAKVKDRPYLIFFDLIKCAKLFNITTLINGNLDTSALFTCPTQQVCVAECPSKAELGLRNNPVCVDGVNTSQFLNISDFSVFSIADGRIKSLVELIATEKCAPYYLPSTPVAGRCIPSFINLDDFISSTLNLNTSTTSSGLQGNFSHYVLTEVNLASIINGSLGLAVALVLSFLYICFMRCLAGVVVWLGIVAGLVLVFIVSGFCYYQFYCFENVQLTLPSAVSSFSELVAVFNGSLTLSNQICVSTAPLRAFIATLAPWYLYQKYTWLAIGIAGTLVLFGLILILTFLGSKIRSSIAIIKEASRAVSAVPTSVIYPVFSWVLLAMLFIYWIVLFLFLRTVSSENRFSIITNSSIASEILNITGLGMVTSGIQCDPMLFPGDILSHTLFVVANSSNDSVTSVSCFFDKFVTSNFVLGLQVYNLFGLFWIGNFIVALGECTLAGAFASYYWAFKKPKDIPALALLNSLGRAVLFHSGSLAFGSLIIAIVQIARVILAYIQKKLKGKSGKVIKVLLCLLQCCFWLLEKVLRYVNRQAYIEIAIYGCDFCTGACKAVKLLVSNVITTAVKGSCGRSSTLHGKDIHYCSRVLAYLGFGSYVDGGSKLWGRKGTQLLPYTCDCTDGGHLLDSLLIHVCIPHGCGHHFSYVQWKDLQRNNGVDKPYFMTEELMGVLGVKNKLQDPHEAWANGNPSRLLYPVDTKGRLCGVDDGVKDKPNLLFFDLTQCARVIKLTDLLSGNVDTSKLFTCPTPQVCVESCPTANELGLRENPVCVDGVDTAPFQNLTSSTDASAIAKALAGNLPSILSGFSALSTVFNETVSISQQICVTTSPLRQFIASTAPWFKYQTQTWLALGIIGLVFFLVTILIFIFLGSKIRISIAIIKEASSNLPSILVGTTDSSVHVLGSCGSVSFTPDSITSPLPNDTHHILLSPHLNHYDSFLLSSSTKYYAVITNTSVASEHLNITGLGVVTNGTQCDPTSTPWDTTNPIIVPSNVTNGNASISCYFNSFVTSNFLLGLQVYNLFGLFWIGNFIVALGECTLAGAFASYYWAFKKPKDVPMFAMLSSLGRAVLFHSGSLAFGSLIIAIVQIARVILVYIQKKMKGKTGKVVQVLLCLLQCCFWLLEKVLRYVNRQAYIEDCCERPHNWTSFLHGKNCYHCSCVLAYLGFGSYVDGGSKLWGGKELNYFLIPVIALMVATYLIASSFMSVYHMAVDTIFICAMEDLERNDGLDKPYFMNKELQNILGVKNKSCNIPDRALMMEEVTA